LRAGWSSSVGVVVVVVVVAWWWWWWWWRRRRRRSVVGLKACMQVASARPKERGGKQRELQQGTRLDLLALLSLLGFTFIELLVPLPTERVALLHLFAIALLR